jgi:TetR/AcrR family transcriptional regulator
MAVGGRGASSGATERVKTSKASPRIAPIYKRLPHGPHRLDRNEVIKHQRARIYGAMVEAVAERGYERTSVKQIIGLAGVSRRSFYEQFANKEECFFAAFDGIATRNIKRLGKAYLSSEGDLEGRLKAALSRFTADARESRNANMLVLVHAQTASAAGTLRLRRVMATAEQMLDRAFSESPEAVALPGPVIRGIIGGLHGAISTVLEAQEFLQRPELVEEMLSWTMLYQTPAAAGMDERMAPALAQRMREISLAGAHPPAAEQPTGGDDRERLLRNTLRLAALHDYRDLTAPQIADEARVPIDVFLELFATKDECFLAALDMVADEILTIVADPALVSDDWARAVRRVLARLMEYLSNHALYARTIAQEAFFAGDAAIRQNLDLATGVATLLTEGAPCSPSSALAEEGIAGAFLHAVRCQVSGGRVQLLPALSDYLSYIVLAPYIGAEEALAIVTEDPERE